MVCGPAGAGKTSVIDMLLRSFPDKLARVPALSTCPPYKSLPAGSHTKHAHHAPSALDRLREAMELGETNDTAAAPYELMTAPELAVEVASGDAFGQCSHAGALYAASLASLSQAWAAGKLPVVEGPLALAAAIKAEQAAALPTEGGGGAGEGDGAQRLPAIEVCCVYLSADAETLDGRLRAAAVMEEGQLQVELGLAVEEEAQVRLAAEAAAAGSGTGSTATGAVVDRVVPAAGGLLETFMAVREVAGQLWHRPRSAIACQLVVDSFDWQSERPMGATKLRMSTVLSAGATLELPRGRHLLRVSANHEQLHAVTFFSRTPISANEYTDVMREAEPGCSSSCLEGDYAAMPAGACSSLLRYNLRVAAPTTLAAGLAVSGEDLRACTRLVLVDNASGSETVVPLLSRLPATELRPTPEGYTLVAVSEVPRSVLPTRPGGVPALAGPGGAPPAAAGGVAEGGTWALSVTSSKAADLEPVSVERVQVGAGFGTLGWGGLQDWAELVTRILAAA